MGKINETSLQCGKNFRKIVLSERKEKEKFAIRKIALVEDYGSKIEEKEAK